MTEFKNIAIIPARGDSKRLPGKNIKVLGDHPLVAHSILYAKRFPDIINKIIVSTDDDRIAEVAKSYEADVCMRPKELALDNEPIITALQHTLQSFSESINDVFLLQPTNPLRPFKLLPDVFKKYVESDSKSLVTVSLLKEKFGHVLNNKFTPANYYFGQRSQDLKPLYKENGLLYIIKSKAIIEGKILTDDNQAYITNSPFDNVDIDVETDFHFAEVLLKKYSYEL